MKRWGLLGLALVFLALYNGAQPDLLRFRTMNISATQSPEMEAKSEPQKQLVRQLRKERYGPSLEWLDRVLKASGSSAEGEKEAGAPKLDGRVLSSLMVAGLASGFKSQVANLLWMKSDEYWHKGLLTRQNPLMEMVVTLDPQFIEAWSTAGWHWAYNVFADIPTNAATKSIKPPALQQKVIRQKQENAIKTGLDYLVRGANMNPDTYRLWFDLARTRAEKAGYYDQETVEFYKIARSKSDARTIEQATMVDGVEVIKEVEGKIDVVGHAIAHIYEQTDVDKALDMWGRDLTRGTPQELALLHKAGGYWRRYGSDYPVIAQLYSSGDNFIKERIRQVIPEAEQIVAAQKMREIMQARASTPTGAFISISARYLPAWKLHKQGRTGEAIKTLSGVMNADPRYHLTDLATMGKIYELRGDSPQIIAGELEAQRQMEKEATQDIGLHLLSKLYDEMARQAKTEREKMAFIRLAYETSFRSKERSQLDFFALRKTRGYEDKYGFTPPQKIVEEIKKSRKSGDTKAAPNVPPGGNPNSQRQPHNHDDHAGEPHREDEGDAETKES